MFQNTEYADLGKLQTLKLKLAAGWYVHTLCCGKVYLLYHGNPNFVPKKAQLCGTYKLCKLGIFRFASFAQFSLCKGHELCSCSSPFHDQKFYIYDHSVWFMRFQEGLSICFFKHIAADSLASWTTIELPGWESQEAELCTITKFGDLQNVFSLLVALKSYAVTFKVNGNIYGRFIMVISR